MLTYVFWYVNIPATYPSMFGYVFYIYVNILKNIPNILVGMSNIPKNILEHTQVCEKYVGWYVWVRMLHISKTYIKSLLTMFRCYLSAISGI